ncbi:MAG: hypothetical protein VX346_19440 [Planctomycetota bacterium]|nr:hypothetical protein [Planctomycetota bacterium]
MRNDLLKRRDWFKSAAVLRISGATAGCRIARAWSDEPDTAINIGSQRQLWCDDYLIEINDGAQRKLHQPQKVNDGQPVLRLEQPWEELGTPILGTVLRDRGKFRMWYRGGGGGPRGGVWCFAESDDGLKWNKPSLGLIEHQGTRQNNIYVLGQPQAYTPFVDPNETNPARRYKSAVSSLRIDTALAHSPHGLVWTPYRGGAAITGRASDTISQVLWDPFARVYRLYTRTDYGTSQTGEVRGTRDMIAASDADLSDPKSWRKVRQWCLGWERGDREYHKVRQLYSVNGWIYEGVQFALIWALELGAVDLSAGEKAVRETMNAYLATTRDGKPWSLEWIYDNRPLFPRGESGRFDSRWIQPAPNIITWKDKHWLYYAGLARSHNGQWSPHITGAKGGIGLATIRRDGFISLHAGARSVSVTTKALCFRGNTLTINAITAPTGDLRAEMQDAAGKPFSGFTLADCEKITGDDIDRVVRWKKGSDVSRLAGKPIRIRFALRGADLFSMKFGKSASRIDTP